MSDTNDRAKPEQPSSTTTVVPRLRLNRDKVKVLGVRTSIATGRPQECSGTCYQGTTSMLV